MREKNTFLTEFDNFAGTLGKIMGKCLYFSRNFPISGKIQKFPEIFSQFFTE